MPSINRLAWPWRIERINLSRRSVKRPKSNLEQLERVERFDRERASFWWQDDNGSMRKKSVSVGLFQRFTPIMQFHFECANDGSRFVNEGLHGQTSRFAIPHVVFPIDRYKIGDTISINRNLACHRRVGPCRPVVKRGEHGMVFRGEARSHSLFRTTSSRVIRQVANRFAEFELRNHACVFRAHAGSLGGFFAVGQFFCAERRCANYANRPKNRDLNSLRERKLCLSVLNGGWIGSTNFK